MYSLTKSVVSRLKLIDSYPMQYINEAVRLGQVSP